MDVSTFDTLVPYPESATGYHLAISQNPISCDAHGIPKDDSLTVTVYRKVGTDSMEIAKGVYISLGVIFPGISRMLRSRTGEITVSLIDYTSVLPKYVESVKLWVGESSYEVPNIAELTIGVAADGKPGEKGDNGRLPVPYGEYSSEVTYTATDQIAPYVLCAGKYYVINKTTSVKGLNPQTDYAANGTNATWILLENYKAIFVELLMANLGLIGKAVFYNEYQYSQYGKKDTVEVAESGKYDVPIDAGGTFDPNLLLNFLTGYFRCNNADIRGIIRAISGNIGGWSITDEGIESEELTQSGGGSIGKNRTVLKKDGTISGNLLNVSLGSGWLRCLLYDDPILEWTERSLKSHSVFSIPFELTSAIIQPSTNPSGGLPSTFLYRLDRTNNLIIEPTDGYSGSSSSVVYYRLPSNLDDFNGVTFRVFNPANRSGSWKACTAVLIYNVSLSDTTYWSNLSGKTNFLGKYTGDALSIPPGKMVVITGVREAVAGGDFGNDKLKWYVEITA